MKTETLRIQNVVDATRLGAWLRSGEGIGWLAAGTMPKSLYRVPFVYLFLAFVFCYYCSFLFLFVFFFVDVPLIFFCPADHVPDWQPRILLGMVEVTTGRLMLTTSSIGNLTRLIHTLLNVMTIHNSSGDQEYNVGEKPTVLL